MRLYLRNLREAATLFVIALVVALAAYSLLGMAWTFKNAVEVSGKIKRSI